MPTSQAVYIMLVDDSEDDVELTLLAFKRYGMANPIHTFRNGLEALNFLQRVPPYADRVPGNPVLMLVDLKMPVMDGVELVRHVRADPAFAAIPIVMLTASQAHTDVVRTYNLGVNGYVVKPVERKQFEEAIQAIKLYWMVVNRPPAAQDEPA
jgi:CheY-like chemotaxis protein